VRQARPAFRVIPFFVGGAKWAAVLGYQGDELILIDATERRSDLEAATETIQLDITIEQVRLRILRCVGEQRR